jgi:hypothetical protein
MSRIHTVSRFNFDSASRQLDSRDLDQILDTDKDMGQAFSDAIAVYIDDAIAAAALSGDIISVADADAAYSDKLVFNVQDYGAVGDGVTNDRTAIQATLNAIPAEGGVVWFPAGTYYVPISGVAPALDVPINRHVTLTGAGRTASILKTETAPAANGTLIDQAVGNTDTKLSVTDLGFEGPTTVTSVATGTHTCIGVNGDAAVGDTSLEVKRCSFLDFTFQVRGPNTTDRADWDIEDCFFDGNVQNSNHHSTPLLTGYADGGVLSVEGCEFQNYGFGMEVISIDPVTDHITVASTALITEGRNAKLYGVDDTFVLPGGLFLSLSYKVHIVDATTISLYTSVVDDVDITDAGGGEIWFGENQSHAAYMGVNQQVIWERNIVRNQVGIGNGIQHYGGTYDVDNPHGNGSLTVSNSIFERDVLRPIYCGEGPTIIDNCQFLNQNSFDGVLTNYEPAISIRGTNVIVSNSTFSGYAGIWVADNVPTFFNSCNFMTDLTTVIAFTRNYAGLACYLSNCYFKTLTYAQAISGTAGSLYLSNTRFSDIQNLHSGTITLQGSADVLRVTISKGAGTPEGVVTANVGSTFHRTNGGAGSSFYVKESGTGNTGWVAK